MLFIKASEEECNRRGLDRRAMIESVRILVFSVLYKHTRVNCNLQYQTVIFTLSTEGGLQASPFAGSWLLAGGWIYIIQSLVARDQGIAGLHSTAQYKQHSSNNTLQCCTVLYYELHEIRDIGAANVRIESHTCNHPIAILIIKSKYQSSYSNPCHTLEIHVI